MVKQLIKASNKEITILGTETTSKEILSESLINFLYGFVGNIVTPFIILKSDFGIFISFFMYYYMLSYILNRAQYETKLGKYIIMPVPCILGAYSSIKIGYMIIQLL